MADSLLLMKDIRKVYYPDIVAINNATFSLAEGEIHALAGENGAGKTTLMKILFGLEKADKGEIYFNSELINIHSPVDAMKRRIGMVHQHFMLLENLTIADNIVLGIEPKRKGLYDYKKACEITRELGTKFDMVIDPEKRISQLTVGLKQKVEIMKVLARDARIIILDEPTAVLTPQETKELFHQLMLLKKDNYTIIIITHKLREIKEICDRVTIMKAGNIVGTYDVDKISIDEISKKMVGYDFEVSKLKSNVKPGKIILDIKGLSLTIGGKKRLDNISFSIREKEILGVVGVEGNGQKELSQVLNGEIKNYDGDIVLDDFSLKGESILEIRKAGISYIPEDRMVDGANLNGSIYESAIVLKSKEKEYQNGIFLNGRKLEEFTDSLINDYGVKCNSKYDDVKSLSGGNIQKIVSAREIVDARRVLIANQPTRGIDIGAVMTLHEKLKSLQSQDKGILLISSDLKEIYDLAESVIVLYDGKVVARINNIKDVNEEQLGRYMLGIDVQENMGASL
ncbi:MAG: ABC transporter ATP-binding protein [Tenericutes bacterium HGW-Tenericutes-5]|nr:MAG: ABC transporter ATP-binding protein [Tenericutes bacterium HGW-Tenericutes-5]